MYPVKFPEQNCTHVADGCGDLPTLRQHNEQFNTEEVTSRWEFSDNDLVAILQQVKQGMRPAIYLTVMGGQPPVSIYCGKLHRQEEHASCD